MPCSMPRAGFCSPRAMTAPHCSRPRRRTSATGSCVDAARDRCCSASACRATGRPASLLDPGRPGPVPARRHHRRYRHLVLPARGVDHLPDPAAAAADRHPDLSPGARAGARRLDDGGGDRPGAHRRAPARAVDADRGRCRSSTPSTRRSTASRRVSAPSATSPPTWRTNCARRWRSCAPGSIRWRRGRCATRLRADLVNMTRTVSQVLDIAELESFVIAGRRQDRSAAVCAEAVGFMAPLAVDMSKTIALTGAEGPVWVRWPSRGSVPRRAQPRRERDSSHAGRRVDRGRRVGRRRRARARRRPRRARGRARDRSSGASGGATAARPTAAGSGLAIVARVAETHDGSVTVENRPGGGAAFTLRLQPSAGPVAGLTAAN